MDGDAVDVLDLLLGVRVVRVFRAEHQLEAVLLGHIPVRVSQRVPCPVGRDRQQRRNHFPTGRYALIVVGPVVALAAEQVLVADRLGVIVRGQEAELRYVVQIDAHQPQHVLEQVARCAHGGEPLARRGGAADDRVQILVRGQLRGKVFGREGFRVHLGVGVVVVNHPQRQAFRGNARRVLLRFHAQAQRRRHVIPAQAAGNHHAHRSRPPLLRGDEAGFLVDGDHGVVARRFPAQRRGDAAVARVLHAHLVAIGVNPMHARV